MVGDIINDADQAICCLAYPCRLPGPVTTLAPSQGLGASSVPLNSFCIKLDVSGIWYGLESNYFIQRRLNLVNILAALEIVATILFLWNNVGRRTDWGILD